MNQEVYETLFNKSNDGIVIVQDGLLKFANPKILEMNGFSREEFIGRPFLDFVAPAYRNTTAENYRRRLTGDIAPQRYEIEIVTRDGRNIPVEISGNRIIFEGHAADMAIVRDMTERRLAEQKLRQAEENFRRALDGLPLGARIVTADNLTLYANRAFLDIYGYASIEELESVPLEKRYTPESYADGLARTEKIMRGEAIPGEFQISIIRRDGAVRALEVFHREIIWNGEKRFLVLYHDITERRRLVEQMMMQDRLASVGEMVSGVAHEINNPLTVILNLADMLSGQELPADARDDVNTIVEESKRIAGIVRNLLTFVRKHPQEKSLVNINQVVRRVIDLRAHEMKAHNIRTVTVFDQTLPQVMASATQLQQVFLNLVINAEYFM
ncbi:MAG: PAS domain S-box protein, partial [Dehalococcoidia bacterium]|nr:PAS domain S-box protein [Dehalococcoidia bacterium]